MDRHATAALTIFLAIHAGSAYAGSYTEDFTTTTFKDPVNTTADWNTADGELKLFPFVPTLEGAYDTPGLAYAVAASGDLAVVADGLGGVHVLDITDPSNPTLSGTYNTPGDAREVVVDGDLAFVADDSGGLQIIDITDPANPSLAGSYSTPGGAFGVAVAGDLVFVAAAASGLQIIDITDPTSPVLAGSFDTPGNANGVAVAGDLAFVADDTSGLQIIGITDPGNPSLAGSYDTPGFAAGVAVAGDLAFVADFTGGLRIVDITDPANPVLAGSHATPGSPFRVAVAGDRAFVAAVQGGLQIVDITDPANPVLDNSYDTPDNAWGVAVAGELAFVADGSSGLQVIGISDPVPPTFAGSYDDTNSAYGVTLAGDLAYVADRGIGLLRVLDISDPTTPTLAGTYDTPGTAEGVAVAGDLALVADGFGGVQLIDISDPTTPTPLGTYDTSPDPAFNAAVSGDLAFVAAWTGGLLVLDISDPTMPTLAGSYGTPGVARGIAVAGDLAFVATATGGLQLIDISDPTAPTLAGSVTTVYGSDVAVAGDLAFVTDGIGNLQLIDISDPTAPTLAGTCDTPVQAEGVAVAGDLAFVADAYGGLQVIDISDPANPALVGAYDTPGFVEDVAVVGNLAFLADGSAGIQVVQVFQHDTDPAGNIGRSLVVNGATETAIRARLSSVQTAGVAWELSADGGASFQAFTPGVGWTELTTIGTDLLWRSTHTWSGGNPAVSEVTLDWLNDVAPVAAIADIPDDEGGRVEITFTRSGYDFLDEAVLPVVGYAIYRRVDAAPLVGRVLETAPAPDREVTRATPLASYQAGRTRIVDDRTFVVGGVRGTTGTLPPGVWEGVGWVLPSQSDTYTAPVHTLLDSTATGIHWSVYVTATHTSDPATWFVSAPDSGYSVDNLPPGAPGNLNLAAANLSWDPAPEPDFDRHTVYGSVVAGLDSTATQIGVTTDTMFDVSGTPFAYYHVTTSDEAGNEGVAATVTDPATDAPAIAAVPTRFALAAPEPNPFRATTSIAFDLPRDEQVRVVIYDTAGRRVRTVVDQARSAGRHEVSWNGTNGAGSRAASGIYFVRLEASGRQETRRVVLLR